MPAGRPKSIDNSKVFDVAKPGRGKPEEFSRPVIINHNIAVQDQTVIGAAQAGPQVSSPSIARKVITPVSTDEVNSTIQPAVKTSITVLHDDPAPEVPSAPEVAGAEKVEEPIAQDLPVVDAVEPPAIPAPETTVELKQEAMASDPSATITPASKGFKRELKLEVPKDSGLGSDDPDSVTEPGESTVKPELNPQESQAAGITDDQPVADGATSTNDDGNAEKPEKVSYGSDSASVDALAEQSDKPKEDRKAEEEQLKRDAALQALIDSKKYVVPLAHDSTKKSGSNSAIIILLLLVLVTASIYLAIDAKVLKLNVNMPYHFFKH